MATRAMTTILLKSLGYENVRNLNFGMQAWTQNNTVNPIRYDPETDCRDYEFVATRKGDLNGEGDDKVTHVGVIVLLIAAGAAIMMRRRREQ